MKRLFYTLFLVLWGLCPLMAQESYYYCQGKKVFLPKNERVRYVGLKNSLTEKQAKSIRENLSDCCTMVYEHTPFFAKYFISEDKIEQFDGHISQSRDARRECQSIGHHRARL